MFAAMPFVAEFVHQTGNHGTGAASHGSIPQDERGWNRGNSRDGTAAIPLVHMVRRRREKAGIACWSECNERGTWGTPR